MSAELILHNAKIATNEVPSFVEAIAITAGKIAAVGNDDEILRLRGPHTRVIDGRRRTVIPGLNDSHMHPIRGGLNYNLELRWDGGSLAPVNYVRVRATKTENLVIVANSSYLSARYCDRFHK